MKFGLDVLFDFVVSATAAVHAVGSRGLAIRLAAFPLLAFLSLSDLL
jgi:hypothetical protein